MCGTELRKLFNVFAQDNEATKHLSVSQGGSIVLVQLDNLLQNLDLLQTAHLSKMYELI